jgi:hypothetical protein
MLWQTLVDLPPFPGVLNYRTPTLFIGSCFAAHIGNSLRQRWFPTTVNPMGTVFHPLAVAQTLQRLRSSERPFGSDDLICANGLWTTFLHHSRFSHPDPSTFLRQANEALRQGSEALQRAQYVFVSLGTSWAYRHKATQLVVNNCHKLPAAEFERFLVSPDAIADALTEAIRAAPVSCSWIFTVSPVRHWVDGAHGNQLSKAGLLLAVEQVRQRCPNAHYFPAYEIMMDELRDYRFYADDLLHPSAQAIEYIWQRFSAVALDDEARQIVREVEKITAAQQHRPLHPETDAYRKFKVQQEEKLRHFAARYPYITIGS